MDEALKQILLPLLGGFLTLVVNWRLRFIALRTTGEKIFLISAVLGVALALAGTLLAFAVEELISYTHGAASFTSAQSAWRQHSPFSFSQLCAFLLGPTLAGLLNRLTDWRRDRAFDWAMDRLGDNLDGVLKKSRIDKKPVLISLRCGRVYVGLVQQQDESVVGGEYIKFFPFLSGFRTPLDIEEANGGQPGGVVFTTVYEDLLWVTTAVSDTPANEILSEVTVEDEVGRTFSFDPHSLRIVVPKCDVESVTIFDPAVYAFLNRRTNPTAWENLVGPPKKHHEPSGDVAQTS